MDKMIFRKLVMKDCKRMRDINPSQFIGRAWREIDGKRILVDINFQDTDWPKLDPRDLHLEFDLCKP